jgi:general secretion pathway protein A
MDYFSILSLDREPFSNSPDPEYFYHSRQHLDCLQKLELSLHLRRGLNVIIGDVGTGKTTLCRQIIRRFAQRKEVETHLILDPVFKDGPDFLATVARLLSGKRPPEETSDWQVKEFIKNSLFRKGVDQKKITVLIIDEGQKIPDFCLEILREFLNYETNEYKLLQIVIFAQLEFESVIRSHPNFADRITLSHHLKPLSFSDTRMMIRFRLEKSSTSKQNLDLFTLPALIAIYRATGGFPRKIINLCHQCILAMIIQNRTKVGWGTVRRCSERVFQVNPRRWPRWAAALGLVAVLAAVGWWHSWPLLRPVLQRPAAAPVHREPVPMPAAPGAPAAAEAAPAPAPAPAAAEGAPAAAIAAAPVAESAPAGPPSVPAAAEPVPPPAAAPTVAALAVQPVEPAPAAVAPPKPHSGPPESLGRITINRNETVSGLIHKVYGQYTNRHFRAIIMANPQIDDPDRILVGQSIQIPAMAVAAKRPNRDAWWVQVGEADTLQEAFELIRRYPESAPPVRVIPFWQPGPGTRFALVFKQFFTSSQAAELQLNLLPSHLAAGSRIVSSWDEDAVFYSDPYYAAKP